MPPHRDIRNTRRWLPPARSSAIRRRSVCSTCSASWKARLASIGWRASRRRSAGCSARASARQEPIKGLYLYGDVGRGKTMLMDLFFEASPVRAQAPRAFPRVHGRRARARARSSARSSSRQAQRRRPDPAHRRRAGGGELAPVLRRIPRHRHRRCHDPRAAVQAAVRARCGGGRDLQRAAGRALQGRAQPRAVPAVHRADRGAHAGAAAVRRAPISGWRSSPASRSGMRRPMPRPTRRSIEAWHRLTGGHAGARAGAAGEGPQACGCRARPWASRASRSTICASSRLAASDYLRRRARIPFAVLDRIPAMDFSRRNEAKRFIILIDTLYDNAVKLVASADAEPDALYRADDGFEAQEFKRTASRLIEMRSESYLALPHGRRDSQRRAGGRHRGDVIAREAYCGLQPRRLDDRRPALGLRREEFGKLRRRIDHRIEAQLLEQWPAPPSDCSAALISALSLLTIARRRAERRHDRLPDIRIEADMRDSRFPSWSARPAAPDRARRW